MRITFNVAVIIGLIAGFVFAGLLATSWYFFKRRTRKGKQSCPEDNYTTFKPRFPSRRRKDQKLRFIDEVDSSKAEGRRPTQATHGQAHISSPKNQYLVPPSRGRSFRSIDTASIYSTDSAPLELHDRLVQINPQSAQTLNEANGEQWQGYPALDPFYSDRLPRTRVLSGRYKQSCSFLPLHNDPTLYEQPIVKHVVPLLYGRGLKA